MVHRCYEPAPLIHGGLRSSGPFALKGLSLKSWASTPCSTTLIGAVVFLGSQLSSMASELVVSSVSVEKTDMNCSLRASAFSYGLLSVLSLL